MQAQVTQQVGQAAMSNKDWWALAITAFFTILAAVGASLLTLWWQARKEKRDAKVRVFTTLMMHRKANPPTFDWVNALNLIDIVFADDEDVLDQWHALYAILCNKPQVGSEIHQHTYINMLSEMAKVLGYKKLQQTDIDKFYSPEVYATQAAATQELNILVRAFFENINSYFLAQQNAAQSPQPDQMTVRPPIVPASGPPPPRS
jgi:hypothetical protein